MTSLLRTGFPAAVFQPFLRQPKDHSVSAMLGGSQSESNECEIRARVLVYLF